MPLDGPTLGALMKANIDALALEDKSDRDELFKALGKAVVAHITAAAVVNIVSVPGVQPGTGVSGPTTGTIT